MTPSDAGFDPLTVLQALERQRVAYVVVGELAEVLQGSGGSANSVAIVPSLRPDNTQRLSAALVDLGVPAADLTALDHGDLTETAVFETRAGAIAVNPAPEGTRGWDDLRRGSNREPLGSGVRPAIAGVADLVRMNEAAGGTEHADRARTLRRMIDLGRDLGVDL